MLVPGGGPLRTKATQHPNQIILQWRKGIWAAMEPPASLEEKDALKSSEIPGLPPSHNRMTTVNHQAA